MHIANANRVSVHSICATTSIFLRSRRHQSKRRVSVVCRLGRSSLSFIRAKLVANPFRRFDAFRSLLLSWRGVPVGLKKEVSERCFTHRYTSTVKQRSQAMFANCQLVIFHPEMFVCA